MGIFFSYSKQTDEHLMVLIGRSDTRAFEELYERYHKRLFYYFLKMLKDEQKAEDFLQDIFLKLVERPHLFDVNRKFHSWVFTVATNMCRMHFRTLPNENWSDHQKEIVKRSNQDSSFSGLDGKLFQEQLQLKLEKLSDEQRETFLLRYQEEFSLQEIADMMNCSLGTVKSRLHYATRQLAQDLEIFKNILKDE